VTKFEHQRQSALFEASHRFLFFDYFRVPYQIDPILSRQSAPNRDRFGRLGRLAVRGTDGSPFLAWPAVPDAGSADQERFLRGRFALGGIPICGDVLAETALTEAREKLAGRWSAIAVVDDGAGRAVSSVWREESGSVLLPFDPSEVISNFWSERYRNFDGHGFVRAATRGLATTYYAVRPFVPRPVQIKLRRIHSRIQRRITFPRWPIESGLHELYSLLFRLIASVAGQPVPWLSPWPSGYDWALVLTHDVEAQIGYDNIRPLQELETSKGYRSSWNLVPRRYQINDADVAEFVEQGFEVGVHGLYHDGLDLAAGTFETRLPEMVAHAKRWGAHGFRSPSTRRDWGRMALLGFEYDSSYPDTDPFEPDPGGCCTWLPLFNENVVELPITLPQDHTLFVILRQPDESAWVAKTEYLRSRGGMALLLSHPDYLLDDGGREAYSRFLDRFATDETAWRPLPHEVASWWRRRAASSIEVDENDWRVVGPAADEAEIRVVEPDVGASVSAVV
jgi:hypothetical protein